MTQEFYTSDIGSIKLMHKNGVSILLNNGYGDGEFKFYVFDTIEEMEKHIANRYSVEMLNIRLDQKGWKVMNSDCAKSYSEDGVELDSDYIYVYQVDQCFMFVLNKEE